MVIVVGIDASPLAEAVLAQALDEARWRGAELDAVHVFQPPAAYLDLPVDLSEVAEADRTLVWTPLESVLAAADQGVRRVDLEGYPPDRLVAYCEEVGADLLVVGTRGRGEIASLVLGSTSHRAVHAAPCDVLVVKP